MNSAGGGLLQREVNGLIDPNRRLAGCFLDHRNAAGGEHDVRALVAQRVVAWSRRAPAPIDWIIRCKSSMVGTVSKSELIPFGSAFLVLIPIPKTNSVKHLPYPGALFVEKQIVDTLACSTARS